MRANMVLPVGLCEEIFARKHTATHKPTSAQPLSAPHSDQRGIHTSNNRLWSPLAYGLGGNNQCFLLKKVTYIHGTGACNHKLADYVQGQCDHGLERQDYSKTKRRETRKDSIIKLRKLHTRKYAARKTKPIKLNKKSITKCNKCNPNDLVIRIEKW